MDRHDIDRIWTLLGKCRQGDEHLKDNDLKLAWALILEPYQYDDVKRAVIAHFRESKYWPDVGEVTKRLPPLPEQAKPPETAQEAADQERRNARIRRDIALMYRDVAFHPEGHNPDLVAKAQSWVEWFRREHPEEAKEVLG